MENIKIINMTPHDINFFDKNGENIIQTIKSSGSVRVDSYRETEEIDRINSIPVNKVKFITGNIENLPEIKTNTIYIVSAIVANATKDVRSDFYIVDNTVRDENHRVIGARALAKV